MDKRVDSDDEDDDSNDNSEDDNENDGESLPRTKINPYINRDTITRQSLFLYLYLSSPRVRASMIYGERAGHRRSMTVRRAQCTREAPDKRSARLN